MKIFETPFILAPKPYGCEYKVRKFGVWTRSSNLLKSGTNFLLDHLLNSKATWKWWVLKIFWNFRIFLYFLFSLIEYGTIINYGFKPMKISKNWYFSHKFWLSIFTQMNLSIIYMLLILKSQYGITCTNTFWVLDHMGHNGLLWTQKYHD
jgi:hypothetical protein